MPDYTSHAAAVGIALVDLVKLQQPRDIEDEEVQLRDDWLDNNTTPFRGASVVNRGEQYSDGTIGTQDVGYLFSIVFAKLRTGDAIMPDDKLIEWYEKSRRRLADQRSLVSITDASNPREHVMIMMPGKTLTDPRKYPNHMIRELVVAAWMRELPSPELTST